ncbi:MAG: DNA primase [Tissierellaceae bacterium]|nr:DNA primase [Tissierellaceae bacterium]
MTTFINDEVVDRVKETSDIVDIISGYVSLKKSGSNFVGLCPFHNEKTPSFTVSESKQYYHCFGCGEGGDSIGFIMKKENLGFVDAVKFLADKYNIFVEEKKVDDKFIEEKERLYNINKEAARYFFEHLGQNKNALEYLNRRHINNKTLRQFGLGYAPNSWDGLYKHLVEKGYKSEEIEKNGLIGRKTGNNGYYDKFRDRIIFPIIDTRSRVIGFGGRVMNDSLPKYLNSKDSMIFNKGNYLYGLNLVNKFSDKKKILLVEGYMDVISLFSSGINYAVASLGTALTERQAKLLKRYGEEIYICYDSDNAGTKATLRAIDILLKEDVKPRIILLPNGMDPDDYIKKMGNIEFNKLFVKSLSHVDYKILISKNKYNLDSIEDKIEFTLETSKIIKSLESPVEQDVYIKKVSIDTGISIDAIEAEVRKGKGYNKPKDKFKGHKPSISPVKVQITSGNIKAELDLILLMIEDKDYFDIIYDSLDADDFSNEEFRSIYVTIINEYKDKTKIDMDTILNLYSKGNPNEEIIRTLRSHSINYQATKIDKIIKDLVNTLIYNKLEKHRREILSNIEVLEKKVRNADEDELLLKYCLDLTNLNNEIKSIRHD